MPAQATFNQGELFRLLDTDPHLSSWEIALALTRHNVMSGRPDVQVTVNTVNKARQRYRLQLEARGVHAKNRTTVLVDELKRRTGTRAFPPEQHASSMILRYLRMKSRLEGGKAIPAREAPWLENWEKDLRTRKRVIDVMDGVPYIRPAGPDELGPDGELKPGGAGLLASAK